MAPPGIRVLSVFLASFAAVIGTMVEADFNVRQVLKICNGQQDLDMDFLTCRGELLLKVEEDAMDASLHDVYENLCLDIPNSHIYAHAVCTKTLSRGDCLNCLNYASDELFDECTNSVGGQITLGDCRVRYEQYRFNNDG